MNRYGKHKPHHRRMLVLAVILLLLACCGACLAYIRSINISVSSNLPVPSPSLQLQRYSPPVIIYFNKFGFDPNELTVPIGTTVTVDNTTTDIPLDFEALYGQTNQNTSLNLGAIPPGASKNFQVAKKGVWQYEGNHNPSIRGEIGTGPLTANLAQLYPDPPITGGQITVTWDDFGFEPNTVSVPIGTTFSVHNISTFTQPGPMRFDEAAAQTNNNPDINLGVIAKQQTASNVLTHPGTWVFENAYQPAAKGQGQLTVYLP